MKQTILTDIDGVVLDWFSGFKKFAIKRGYMASTVGNPKDWGLDDSMPHVDVSEVVREYNRSAAFGRLEGYQDAIDVIPNLYYKHEFLFHGVTKSSDNAKSIKLRRLNLDRRLGLVFSDNITFVNPKKSKTRELKKFNPTIWIEDKPEGALEGLAAGHECYLIDRSYNRKFKHPGVTRVRGWYEIRKLLLGET